MYVSFLHIK